MCSPSKWPLCLHIYPHKHSGDQRAVAKCIYYHLGEPKNIWGRKIRRSYFLVSSSLEIVLMISSFLACSLSSRRLRASRVFVRRASAWSLQGEGTQISIALYRPCLDTFTAYCHRIFHSIQTICDEMRLSSWAVYWCGAHWVMFFGHLRQELLAGLVCLELVNVLHQDTFVLEHVTLRPQIQAVVPEGETELLYIYGYTLSHCVHQVVINKNGSRQINMFTVAVIKSWYTVTEYNCIKLNENKSLHVPVDLLGLSVTSQKSSQNTHTSHPAQLLWHTSICRTLSLTCMQTQPEKSSSINAHFLVPWSPELSLFNSQACIKTPFGLPWFPFSWR